MVPEQLLQMYEVTEAVVHLQYYVPSLVCVALEMSPLHFEGCPW